MVTQYRLLLVYLIFMFCQRGLTESPGSLLRLIQTEDDKLGLQCPAEANRVVELYRDINDIIARAETKTTPVNPKGKELAHRFKQKLRSYIVHKNGKELATHFNGPDTRSKDYGTFVANLLKDYEKPVISAIFTHALKEMIDFRPAEVLALFLWQIYKHHLFKEKIVFVVMVEQQLRLYWRFKRSRERNNVYIFNVSFYLYKIKTDPFYKELSEAIRSQMDEAIVELPANMKQLFFEPYFCLLNKKYEENLYATEPQHRWDSYRYRVYSWADKTWVESHGQFRSEIHEVAYATTLYLKFLLRSVRFNVFLYMDTDRIPEHANVIAAWDSENPPANSEWNVELSDDHLTFGLDAYLMCNSNRFNDAVRRFVYGFHDGEHTKSSPECQWVLDNCTRYMNVTYDGFQN